MKFSTFAIFSCAVASVVAIPTPAEEAAAAVPAQEGGGFHPLDAARQMWRNHKAEEALEDKHEAAEKEYKKTLKAENSQALHHGNAGGGFSLADGREKSSLNRQKYKNLKHENKHKEDDFEKANDKIVADILWGRKKLEAAVPENTAPVAAAAAKRGLKDTPVEASAIEKRGLKDAWAAWREGSKREDKLEEKQKGERKDQETASETAMKEFKKENRNSISGGIEKWRQVEDQEDQLEETSDKSEKEMKARHKKEMKELKAENWKAVKAAYNKVSTPKAQ